jgi:TolB-like protein
MNSFLTELRRRNVFRVAAGYLVAGWIVLQVVGAIENAAGLPAWADGFALVVLVTGFPIVLFIAWAFELTPDGMKKTEAGGGSVGFKPLGTSDYVLIAAVIVVLGVAGAQFVTRSPAPTSPGDVTASRDQMEPARPSAASIAVLPFADLSPDGDQVYFGDGIAEEILNVLTRVDGLHVASRTSAFQFRGDDFGIPAIAEQLNVRHVVEGSVRKAGNTLRITAQLIDSEGDRHLWSDTFDRPLTTENIFAIQDEIATEIVAALSAALGMEAPEVSVEAGTENLDAYELFLRGQAIFHRRNLENIPQGIEYFEQAVAADPGFARGWAGLAAIYGIAESWVGEDNAVDYRTLAEDAANRSTALNPDLSLPYSIRGLIARDRRDWTEAVGQANAAVDRDPSSANAWYFRGGIWLDAGYFDAAVSDFTAALERDPAYSIVRRHLAFAELYRGHTDRALELYQQGVLDGQESNAGIMIPVYFARRDTVTALYNLAYVNELYGDTAYNSVGYRFFSDFNVSDEELDRLRRAVYLRENGSLDGYEPRDREVEIHIRNNHGVIWNPYWPNRFRAASRDAFFAARHQVIQDMRLPEFWRENGFPPQCRPIGEDDFECGWIDETD